VGRGEAGVEVGRWCADGKKVRGGTDFERQDISPPMIVGEKYGRAEISRSLSPGVVTFHVGIEAITESRTVEKTLLTLNTTQQKGSN
jgi:hypothetical protein